MSYIAKVEAWRDDIKTRLARFGPETPYGQELQRTLAMYEKLLGELREIHKPKQGSLLREMGDEIE